MDVNLWGASPLYVNPVPSEMMVTEILSEGKGGTARDRLKGWSETEGEPRARVSATSVNLEAKA
jgi:hypothetical protein